MDGRLQWNHLVDLVKTRGLLCFERSPTEFVQVYMHRVMFFLHSQKTVWSRNRGGVGGSFLPSSIMHHCRLFSGKMDGAFMSAGARHCPQVWRRPTSRERNFPTLFGQSSWHNALSPRSQYSLWNLATGFPFGSQNLFLPPTHAQFRV